MRVLSVVPVLSQRLGGGNAERTAKLARALSLLGAQCEVLTMNIGDPGLQSSRIGAAKLIVIPCLSERFQVPFLSLRSIKSAVLRANIIHFTGHWSALSLLVGWYARRYGVPYVVCPAGALPVLGRSKFKKIMFNLLAGKSFVTRASGWVAVTTREVLDFEKYGISRDAVAIIPNGIELDDFKSIECPNGLFERPTHRPYVLFMGRLNWIKGPDLLLDAFILISREFPDIDLVYAGVDEGLGELILHRARKAGVSARVHQIGFVSGEYKNFIYRSSCLLVVPSRSEAMSLVAIEAGACAVPVLMTDECGLIDIREVSEDLLVSPAAGALAGGLRTALSDLRRLERFGVHWRSIVLEHYVWRDIAARLLMYFRSKVDIVES